MSIEFKEAVSYSIIDCRDLSRAEMLAFIASDVCEGKVSIDYLYNLTVGSWTIYCDPLDKSIYYTSKSKNYIVRFAPVQEYGMQINYTSNNSNNDTIYVVWSANEVIDMIGA